MTKEQAIERVAAMLAFNTFDHEASARKLPHLRQNTEEAKASNLAVAVALGCEDRYRAGCSTLDVEP